MMQNIKKHRWNDAKHQWNDENMMQWWTKHELLYGNVEENIINWSMNL